MATVPKVKRRNIVKPLGKAWGKTIQEIVTEAALKQARFELRSGKHVDKEEVDVVITTTVHMSFPKKGKTITGDGGVKCNCTSSSDSAGTVCICVGPGAADCDCPIFVVA
jgi:hypothetical protein